MNDKIKFRIEAEPEDEPVRGNFASGDDAKDKALEDEIIAKIDSGDTWAWASVCVLAEFEGFKGRAYLGCCSYEDEADFVKEGMYYEQMKADAVEDLKREIKRQIATGEDAKQALIQLGEE